MQTGLFESAPAAEPIIEPADLENQAALLWSSEPMRIGRHDWRLIVFEHDRYGRCTRYEFRGPAAVHSNSDGSAWSSERKWPSWDGNHSDGGMPKTLRALFDRNEAKVRELIPRAGSNDWKPSCSG